MLNAKVKENSLTFWTAESIDGIPFIFIPKDDEGSLEEGYSAEAESGEGTQIGIAELKGKTRHNQEDSLMVCVIDDGYSSLAEQQKQNVLTDAAKKLQQGYAESHPEDKSGTTATGTIIGPDGLTILNIGDSTTFYLITNKNNEVVEIVRPHSLHDHNNEDEQKRIQEIVNGYDEKIQSLEEKLTEIKSKKLTLGKKKKISSLENKIQELRLERDKNKFFESGRLGGYVYTSRDISGPVMESKAPSISHEPEVSHHPYPTLNPGQKLYLIVACDGLTEKHDEKEYKQVDGYQKLRQWFQTLLKANRNTKSIAQGLVAKAYQGDEQTKGSADNISVAVVEVDRDNVKAPTFVAVFDGHGGKAAAEYCCEHAEDAINDEVQRLSASVKATTQKLSSGN